MTADQKQLDDDFIALLRFQPDAGEKELARAAAKEAAWAELSDVLVDETGRSTSLLGTPFVDDDGVPGHVLFFGGEPNKLREWAFLTTENAFFNLGSGERVSRAAFDLSMAKVTPTVKITKEGGDENKKFPASRTLVEFLNGAIVSGTMYRPDLGVPLFEYEGQQWANSYLRESVPVAETNWHGHPAWLVVRNHIHNIVPDGAKLLIQWLAHNVQYPGLKINWVPTLIGVPGDGKTSIAQALAAAMGRANVGNVSSDALFSGFSSWAAGKAVQVLEEIRVSGQNRHTCMDKMKVFITNAHVPVHKKGINEFDVINTTNYLAFSNHLDALALTEDDRRWVIWKTRFKDRPHVRREIPKAYFDSFYDALERYPGVIRSWLLSIDLSGFDRTSPPVATIWRTHMIEASRGSTEVEVREAIGLGGFGIGDGILATDCLNDAIHRQCGRKAPTSQLAAILERLGWIRLGGTSGGRKLVKWNGLPRTIYYRPDRFAMEPDAEVIRLNLPSGKSIEDADYERTVDYDR